MNISLFYPSVVVVFLVFFSPYFSGGYRSVLFLSLISLQHKLLSCEELCIEPKMTICLFFFFFEVNNISTAKCPATKGVKYCVEVIFIITCGSLGYTV